MTMTTRKSATRNYEPSFVPDTVSRRIEELKEEIIRVENDMRNFEINPENHEDAYKELLNEIHSPFMGKYDAGNTLELIDPVAYRCGLLDYVDSRDINDDPGYRALAEELRLLQDELEELEDDELS